MEGPLLGDLMADLIVVPSMGDRKTFESSLHQAHVMAVANRTRTFVVQCPHEPNDDLSLGWVIDKSGSGRTGPLDETFAVFTPKPP